MSHPSDPSPPASFPDDSLPDGAVVDGEALAEDLEEAFDYVVVGSGAAGAVAAHVLAAAGWSVALVEEGPWVKTRDFGDRVLDAFQRMLRDAGTQVMQGRSYVPVLQGRCVGGSTVVNSAIAHRTPEDVLDEWARRFGLGSAITARALEPHFEALERDLHVSGVGDEALGRNNRMFLDEASTHGLPAERMRRYERGCRGSARCLTGCPSGAKQGMNVTYVPWALRLGARLFTCCRVERVIVKARCAVGVVGRAGKASVTLLANRGVLVAASTVQTPNLLSRSGLRARDLGRHFQCHPSVGIGGLFDEPVEMAIGATQGAESIHLRKTDRIKLETLSMPPELAAVRTPGIGRELMRRLGVFSHVAVWALGVRAEGEGDVSEGWGGRDKIKWSPRPIDVERARKGVALLARMMFEAGAREVWPGLHGLPSTMTSVDQVGLIDAMPAEARAFGFISTHLFGAARMGLDERAGVVGTDFQTHEVDGLYVVDSSVFPTNLGVNPQHSIMAMSRLAATRIAAGGRRARRAA